MKEKCHFIGIGGIGMSGLARILLSKNIQVSGSDISTNYVIEDLVKAGAKVYKEHSPQNISADMTVIYTSDIKKDNPEFQAAKELQCKLLHRSDLLVDLMKGYKTLAVAGTHGKTTTSALLTTVLVEGEWDPSYAVGGMLPKFQSNSGYGSGDYFIAEADESDGTFLKYDPHAAIVTNIDRDHMDYYQSRDALEKGFKSFMSKVSSPEFLFWCGDDPWLAKINPIGQSYGFQSQCSWKISNFRQEGWNIIYDLEHQGNLYPAIQVALTGHHNALNSTAVFGLALTLGIPEKIIRKAFLTFQGVMRRCEKKGETHGILILDDYAHHPTEIRATLSALREVAQDKRLITVFQPHRYTRTQDCLGSFGDIFDASDELIITDIYGAREVPIPGITSGKIIDEIKQKSSISCHYIPRDNLLHFLGDFLCPHDIVVGLGAGDITKLGSDLLSYLQKNPPRKFKVGLIFGGRSLEHEVSLMSAKNVYHHLNRDFYEIYQFGITSDGTWVNEPGDLNSLKEVKKDPQNVVSISPEVINRLNECDLFFPVLHGPYGEDGTLQGLFEMLNKPYTGCDYQSSAVCMDKALTKKLMLLNGIPTIPFFDFSYRDWKNHKDTILGQIETQLVFPLFVKPVHLGSTVGVVKVDDKENLKGTIEKTFKHDYHVIVENGLNVREIEFAILGNTWVKTYPPGEILTGGKIYQYEDKYGPHATKTVAKADLPYKLVEEGKLMAEMAYKAAGCCGMARVDFFLDDSNKFWLNEINPIPGFTKNSLFPKICEANGLSGNDLIDKLIVMALERNRQALKRG